MKNIYLLLILLLFSCSSEKGLTAVKYKASKFSKNTYKIMLPKGFKITEIHGGNEWRELSYEYNNNSVFYITNERGRPTILLRNIQNDTLALQKTSLAFFLNDTITIQGIDKKGKYWKNKYDGKVNIGYLNISIEKKEEFDKILSSIDKK